MSKRRHTLIGMAIGASMGVLIWVVVGELEAIPPSATLAVKMFEVIHYPAVLLVFLWSEIANIHDPAAWLALPYAVVAQWALVGLLCGWWLHRKKRAKGPARKATG